MDSRPWAATTSWSAITPTKTSSCGRSCERNIPMSVEVIRAISLGQFPHGFLGRRGGMSVGEHAGLNVGYGSDDDREAIAGNRRLAISALHPEAELATVHQIHSAEVVVADQAWAQDERPRADAMVTDT